MICSFRCNRKKECPKCRVKCPSRRSLRRDEKYDSLIKSIFPNLGEFQKEEELWIERMNKEQLEDMKKSDPIAADRSIANADRTTTTREETLLLDYQVFLTPLNRDGPQRFLRTTSSCSVEDIILYIEAYMIGTGHRVNCLYINREDRDIRLHSSQTMMEIYDFDQDFLTVFY
jgi:hypothetical protein